MHQETLLYIVHQLDRAAQTRVRAQQHRGSRAPNRPRDAQRSRRAPRRSASITTRSPSAGTTSSGAREVDVAAFRSREYPVTNGQWLRFVADGRPGAGVLDRARRRVALRLTFEEIPLPLSWPVYVTHRQAEAYARWAGMRLPDRGGVPSRRVRHARRGGASLSVGLGSRPRRSMATSALRASTPSRSTRIPPATAPGALPTSSATAGSGPPRRLRRCPASSRWPRIRSTRPISSTAGIT